MKQDRHARRRFVGGENAGRAIDADGIGKRFFVREIGQIEGRDERVQILSSGERKAAK